MCVNSWWKGMHCGPGREESSPESWSAVSCVLMITGNMNCQLLSTGLLTLLLLTSSLVGRSSSAPVEDGTTGRSNSELVPLWLRSYCIYQAQGLPSQDVANTLKAVLKEQTFMDCSLPYQGHNVTIGWMPFRQELTHILFKSPRRACAARVYCPTRRFLLRATRR